MRNIREEDIDAVLAINQLAMPGVTSLDAKTLREFMNEGVYFKVAQYSDFVQGYLCAFESHSAYEGDEFRWFQTNMAENFIYIDQVAVHPQYRDRGMAESMYKDLENYALTQKIHILVCEVNFIPRNDVSLSFHKKLGFREIGRMQVRGITVSLMQNTMHNPDE